MSKQVKHLRVSKNNKLFAAGKRKVVHLRKVFEGCVTSPTAALSTAKRLLKNYGNNSTILLQYYNGIDIFIKKNGKVRGTTRKEFSDMGIHKYNLVTTRRC